MVIIRLSRGGSKKKPFYSIHVADQRRANRGRFIERVGFYNPRAAGAEERLRIDLDRINYWMEKGAQPTPRVKSLMDNASSAAPAAVAAAPAAAPTETAPTETASA